jgi:hypothetical protein
MNLFVAVGLALALAASGGAGAEPAAALRVPTTGSALGGVLDVDGRAEGTLVATSDGLSFHAFVVDVPPDALRWTLELDADADLSLALRYRGMTASAPADPPPGGGWDRFDVGVENPTVVIVERPPPGPWSVVVVARLEPGAWGTYVLASAIVRGTATESGVAGTYLCRASDALLRLRIDDDGRIVGTLEGTRARYDVDAVATVDGAYGVIWNATGWIGFLALSAPAGLTVVLFELDAESHAIRESARWMRFDRIGGRRGP